MTETNVLTCPFPTCGYTPSRPAALQSHIKLHHEIHPETEITVEGERKEDGNGKVKSGMEALLGCDKCSYQTPSGVLMHMHTRIHLYEKPSKCPNLGCNYRGRLTQSLQVYHRSCRSGRQMKPSQGTIPTEKSTKEGSRVYLTEVETRMESAGAAAKTLGQNSISSIDKPQGEGTAEISMEQVRMERDVLFCCKICRFASKWRPNLIRHVRVHMDRQQLRCPSDGCDHRAKCSQSNQRHPPTIHGIDLSLKQSLKTQEILGSNKDLENNTDVNAQSSSTAFACMLCEFIGDSVLSALKHVHQHKTVAISNQ